MAGNRLHPLSADARVAIVRLSALGDVIHTLPAVMRLREALPSGSIDWLCSSPADRLLSVFEIADRVRTIDIRHRSIAKTIGELRRLRGGTPHPYSLVIDFQGLIKSALVSRLAGKRVLGFHKQDLREPLAALGYTFQAEKWVEGNHVIHKNIHLLSALGIESEAVRYPQISMPRESTRIQAFINGLASGRSGFAIINTGAGWPTKTPRADLLSALGAWLKTRLPVVLLWGTGAERQSALNISLETGIPLAPATDFSELVTLIRNARFLISADTLALHLADAAGTPSVGLFGPTSPERNGSLLDSSRSVVPEVDCRYCYRRECKKMNCMAHISLESLRSAVSEVLRESG